jgi:MoaA/NifB/PqqE/SkfB family radical SAM enzyme
MARRVTRPYWGLPFYLYLTGAYAGFLATGRCLRSPYILHLQTKSLCNGRCSICPYRVVSKELEQGEMEWDLFFKIVGQAASEPLLSRIVFELHNEPLLDRRIWECVRHVKTMCPAKQCAMVTNGQLLDRFSLAEIHESKLDQLMISLNAHTRETYEKINNGLDYDRVMQNVARLLSDRDLKKKVMLSFVVTSQNHEEIPRAVRHWRDRGVRTEVRGMVNRAGTLNGYTKHKSQNEHPGFHFFASVRDRMLDGMQRVIGCPLPFYQMSVLFNGDAILCCNDWNRESIVGNLEAGSLREVWNSEKLNAIRKRILQGRYEEVESCRGCSAGG